MTDLLSEDEWLELIHGIDDPKPPKKYILQYEFVLEDGSTIVLERSKAIEYIREHGTAHIKEMHTNLDFNLIRADNVAITDALLKSWGLRPC